MTTHLYGQAAREDRPKVAQAIADSLAEILGGNVEAVRVNGHDMVTLRADDLLTALYYLGRRPAVEYFESKGETTLKPVIPTVADNATPEQVTTWLKWLAESKYCFHLDDDPRDCGFPDAIGQSLESSLQNAERLIGWQSVWAIYADFIDCPSHLS